MAFFDAFKVSRKTFFNPKGWLGWDGLKDFNLMLWATIQPLFTTPVVAREESFEMAVERLGLTEADLKAAQKNYRYYALFFFLFGLADFTYSFYLLFSHGSIGGLLLGFATTMLFWSQAFRYDFWSYQIRSRKLGVTFIEWRNNILGIKDKKV